MPRLADVIRRAGPSYVARFGRRILPSHRRAMADIAACRTPAMGGHACTCRDCSHTSYHFHSCRNRHCPTCQGDRAHQWLNRHLALLLPCPYYLVTITVPAELRPLARSCQRTFYDLLIRECAKAVLELCADPKWLGARPAILANLHTCTRDLFHHPHVHLLVSAGGLDPAGETWVKPANPRFLLPGYALDPLVRGKICTALARLNLFPDLPPRFWEKKWSMQVKRLRCGEHALRYLARYLFRVAISDKAIVAVDNDQVTFRFFSNSGQLHHRTLKHHAFLARFLQHVLPSGFVRVRTYGLWASALRSSLRFAQNLLHRNRDALGSHYVPLPTPPDPPDEPRPRSCPKCGSTNLLVSEIKPQPRGPP